MRIEITLDDKQVKAIKDAVREDLLEYKELSSRITALEVANAALIKERDKYRASCDRLYNIVNNGA